VSLTAAQQEAQRAWMSASRPYPGVQITTLLEASYQADQLSAKIASVQMHCLDYQDALRGAGSVLQLTRDLIARQLKDLGYAICWSEANCEYLLRDREGAVLMWQTVLDQGQRERIARARSRVYGQENRANEASR
jgi:hypothetical protein